jgi:hypothetical protein
MVTGASAPFAARYDRALDAWSPMERIDGRTTLNSTRGTPVGSDRKGNVLVAFVQRTGSDRTWVTRFAAATQVWSTPLPLEDTDPDSLGPSLAAGPNGHALAVWQETSGAIRARVYR